MKSESLSPQTQFKRAKSALKNTMAFEEHSYSKNIDLANIFFGILILDDNIVLRNKIILYGKLIVVDIILDF